MGDACKTITIAVDIQENGIIRLMNGQYIGRLDRDTSMKEIAKELDDAGLDIVLNAKGKKL